MRPRAACQRADHRHEDFIALRMSPQEVTLDKPVQRGFSIVERSKWLMFDFSHNVREKIHPDGVRLSATDADSVVFDAETEDFYEDVQSELKGSFDRSNFPNDHPPSKCAKQGSSKMRLDAATGPTSAVSAPASVRI